MDSSDAGNPSRDYSLLSQDNENIAKPISAKCECVRDNIFEDVEFGMLALNGKYPAVGIKGKAGVVVVSFRRNQDENKETAVFINPHCGISSPVVDSLSWSTVYKLGRVLGSFENLYIGPSKIIKKLKKVPLDFNFFLAGYDNGAYHLYTVKESSNPNFNYLKVAGTYLEENAKCFPKSSMTELIVHALRAMHEIIQFVKITDEDVVISFVTGALSFEAFMGNDESLGGFVTCFTEFINYEVMTRKYCELIPRNLPQFRICNRRR